MQQLAKKAFLKQMKSNAIKERKLLKTQQAVDELIYKPSCIMGGSFAEIRLKD